MRINGKALPYAMQQEAKRLYVHRFTGDHKPLWANTTMLCGKPYPVQFANDEEWLAHTEFEVTKKGRFSRRETYCHSQPTWPNNPELRREAAQ